MVRQALRLQDQLPTPLMNHDHFVNLTGTLPKQQVGMSLGCAGFWQCKYQTFGAGETAAAPADAP